MVEDSRRGFSESVRDQISSLARELAGQGEEAFVALITKRGELAIASAQISSFAPKTDENSLLAKKLGEDVAIMDEILSQARAIRQLTGQDPSYEYLARLAESGKID